jgi:hypothetical protein
VTTTTGTSYEDVSVVWTLEGFSLRMTAPDGTETDLRPSEVAAIHDSDGNDITNAVADANPATNVDFALIGDRRIVPLTFDLMLTGGGGGALYQAGGGLDPTWAVSGGVRIGLGERFHVHTQYRRQRIVEPVHTTGGEITDFTDELHLLLGFRATHPRENNNYHYVELGLAAVRFPDRYHAGRRSWNGRGGTGAGFTLQGGVVYPFSSRVGLDLTGTFMLRPTLVEDSSSTGLLFGINAALAVWW